MTAGRTAIVGPKSVKIAAYNSGASGAEGS
jgi:hypothetical protein